MEDALNSCSAGVTEGLLAKLIPYIQMDLSDAQFDEMYATAFNYVKAGLATYSASEELARMGGVEPNGVKPTRTLRDFFMAWFSPQR